MVARELEENKGDTEEVDGHKEDSDNDCENYSVGKVIPAKHEVTWAPNQDDTDKKEDVSDSKVTSDKDKLTKNKETTESDEMLPTGNKR